MSMQADISRGLEALEIPSTPQLSELCEAYLLLIEKWNRVTNLTAIKKPQEMIAHHLLDSVALQPFIRGQTLLDIGSGAGLPGIPLALLNPDKDFILLDANGKKARFMTQATIELGLTNVEVVHDRVESISGLFDQIMCRAFASLTEFVTLAKPLLKEGGSLLAMKGPREVNNTSLSDGTLVGGLEYLVHPLVIPGLEGERYLVEVAA